MQGWLAALCVAFSLPFVLQFLEVDLFSSARAWTSAPLSTELSGRVNDALEKCAIWSTEPIEPHSLVSPSRSNPRWISRGEEDKWTLLSNAILFDGERFLSKTVDILLNRGIIVSVSPKGQSKLDLEREKVEVVDVQGKHVTPGLVDMHSHHLIWTWPAFASLADVFDTAMASGPLTPFLKVKDSMKPDDWATAVIASGGVTSSLVLPGSVNLMAGEAYMVKNTLRDMGDGKGPVESLMLDYGIPESQRRRYMKMAVGHGTRDAWKRSRMGSAWLLRQHLARAREVKKQQDSWCATARTLNAQGKQTKVLEMLSSLDIESPQALEMESTVAMLRGRVGAHFHILTPEDMEQMIELGEEFGFRIQGFHHAMEAWKVTDLLRRHSSPDRGNITIATFATFGLHTKEGFDVNLEAGRILAESGIPVAYKSDHSSEFLNGKYILYQAAIAHSFQLPEEIALESVTSVPAKSLEQDHRIGYARPGYDADLVVWNSHPLALGATPEQVYIDGQATLDPVIVSNSLSKQDKVQKQSAPKMRQKLDPVWKKEVCTPILAQSKTLVVTGITKSFLDDSTAKTRHTNNGNNTLVISNGRISCFGPSTECTSNDNPITIHLQDGHVIPGLTAVTTHLGLAELRLDDSTGDGIVSNLDPSEPVRAKYGVNLQGKAFRRAQIGGITRAVTPPLQQFRAEGFWGGVSVGIKTGEHETSLEEGIFKDEVALHVLIGQGAKATGILPTVSSAIATLKRSLAANLGQDNIYGAVANGSLPLVAHTHSKYDILQLLRFKAEYNGQLNLVILGGAGAPAVAKELAEAEVPVILTSFRAAPDTWEKRDAMVGPPLTPSPAQVLADAGVTFAIAIAGIVDSDIQNLLLEASWVAKYLGISDREAVDLVSRNVEKILGLPVEEATRDFVVYDSNPLEFGASVVVSVDVGKGVITTCYPEELYYS